MLYLQVLLAIVTMSLVECGPNGKYKATTQFHDNAAGKEVTHPAAGGSGHASGHSDHASEHTTKAPPAAGRGGLDIGTGGPIFTFLPTRDW